LKPLAFVIFQLIVLAWAIIAHVRHDSSGLYRLAWLGSFCGVIGLDVWYLANYAYPSGFSF
jgi:hypothetical protein